MIKDCFKETKDFNMSNFMEYRKSNGGYSIKTTTDYYFSDDFIDSDEIIVLKDCINMNIHVVIPMVTVFKKYIVSIEEYLKSEGALW